MPHWAISSIYLKNIKKRIDFLHLPAEVRENKLGLITIFKECKGVSFCLGALPMLFWYQLFKMIKLGGVDILINNAAVDLSNLFHLKNAEEFRKTLDVNVVGAFNCSKRVYRHMIDQEYGKIINIASTNGINTYYPMCIDYDASKAALISMTHNLAFEFAPFVNVNCIAPGFIGTENELDGYDEQFLKEEVEKIMVNRYGDPQEVAYLVKFLVSKEADFINNTVIRIDGGQKGSC